MMFTPPRSLALATLPLQGRVTEHVAKVEVFITD